MRFLALFGIVFVALNAGTPTSASTLWNELKARRESLTGVHQEFEVSDTSKTARDTQSSKRQIVLDMSPGQWRERSVTGSGNHIRIFDGKDLFWMEEGGDEFVRIKRHSKDQEPVPSPYGADDPDWSKAVERERRPCGIPGKNHVCVVLEAPLKRWTRNVSPTDNSRMVEGSAAALLDTETGLLVLLRTVQANRDPQYWIPIGHEV